MDAYSLVTPPVSEPITLTEAKAWVRQDGSADDTLLTSLISAARSYAESVYGCLFMTQTWCLSLDRFPDWEIVIRKRPLQSVDSIKYIDSAGIQQTLDPSLYSVNAKGFLGRITPAYGQVWPSPRCQIGAVEIQFKAGWGFIQSVLPDSADYVVATTPNWNTTVGVSGKTPIQFQLDFGTAAPASAKVDWSAQLGAMPVQLYTGIADVVEDDLSVIVSLGVPVLLSYVVGGIPEHLRKALLLMIDELYEHREANFAGVSQRLEMTTRLLFASERVMPV